MLRDRLEGTQYVRLAPGAADAVARYLRVPPAEIGELVVDAPEWPEDVRPAPMPAQDGRLLAGDPVAVGATDVGLLLATRPAGTAVLRWDAIRHVEILPG